MKSNQSKPSLWSRFLAWRRADGTTRTVPVEEAVPNKVAAEDGDITAVKYSNTGGGWGSGGA